MAKNKNKSVFGEKTDELKAHVESVKNNKIDITTPSDPIADELEEMKEFEESLLFNIPSEKELQDAINSIEDSKDPEDFDTLKEEELEVENTIKNQEEPIKVTNVNNYSNLDKTQNLDIKSNLVKEAQTELEEFKNGVQKLMSDYGYTFMQAKAIFEKSKEPKKSNTRVVQIIRTNTK